MMRLDHVNIRCTDLEATSQFLQSVVGLKPGWRPAFGIPGYWLEDDDGRPVAHLIGARSDLGEMGAVDHIAFRYDPLEPQLEHLRKLGYSVDVIPVPGTPIHQCFVFGPDRLQVEFQGPLSAARSGSV